MLIIKDISGNAGDAGKNITVTPNGSDKIDAPSATYVISSDYGSVTLIADETSSQWVVV